MNSPVGGLDIERVVGVDGFHADRSIVGNTDDLKDAVPKYNNKLVRFVRAIDLLINCRFSTYHNYRDYVMARFSFEKGDDKSSEQKWNEK
jgi:hypothetical protein